LNYKRRFSRLGKTESGPEVRYRLHNEGEARKLADKIKGMIEPGLGFVLITCTYGGSGEPFQNTSYIATVNREDSARLLCEMLDHWENAGTVTEPRVETATQLREAVHEMRELSLDDLLGLIGECLKDLARGVSARCGLADTGAAALGLAALGVSIYDHLKRSHDASAQEQGASNAGSIN
jgi:hypothetical protein